MTGSFSRLFQSRGRTQEIRGIIDISYHIRIISLPHMQSRIHDGSSQARNPSVTLGFPGNRAVKLGGSVIVS